MGEILSQQLDQVAPRDPMMGKNGEVITNLRYGAHTLTFVLLFSWNVVCNVATASSTEEKRWKMVRPPCCDRDGVKKGPWTPEEDIVLIAYIREHGPGNWSAVPAKSGLSRCSKSCRLRWTNYLRPGIKRGNFTPHEEGMIIHLQALLGNKWAAIASYLPQRTDNDIKNYWNTHLKKKLKKLQSAMDPQNTSAHAHYTKTGCHTIAESSSLYASSAENISKLLQKWMTSSSPSLHTNTSTTTTSVLDTNGSRFYPEFGKTPDEFGDARYWCKPQEGGIMMGDDHELMELDRGLINSVASSSDSCGLVDHEKVQSLHDNYPPLSFLEKWLLDENAAACQIEGNVKIPPMFSSHGGSML